ncbi:MAG: anthranilate phosphoribosyltransferase [Candidatus Omnitrophica bacterium]|nr:anthranilate phosphoribosyltransferase [Candidatus Omnitrophota bacterium]
MIKDSIRLLIQKKDLTEEQMLSSMEEILNGFAETADIVEFLAFLNVKGETPEELTTAVKVMLKYVEPIIVDKPNILDTCGTGGDKKGTFNISTLSAFVASGAGITVAKHGNRSVSSKCGSADILEALGVNIQMDRGRIKQCLEEIGIAFLFAPNLHKVMQKVMPARRQIGGRTIFNILGPLINPAGVTNQLIGVYDRDLTMVLAKVLHNLGRRHALVVHGEDGLDEITTTEVTYVSEVNNGRFSDYKIIPEDFGLKRARFADLLGGSLQDNLEIAMDLLKGKSGPKRDILLLNAGAAIYAADRTTSIKEGIALAAHSIDSGAALEKLQLLKEYSYAKN